MYVFISTLRNFSFSLTVNNGTYQIGFRDKGKIYGYSQYICYDKTLAEALMKHPHYGVFYTLKESTEHEKPTEREFDAVYPDVKRTQEANKILVEKYGIAKDVLSSKDDALEQADKLNISFPNL